MYAETSSSEEDVPLASSPAKPAAKPNGRAKKVVKKEESDGDAEDESEAEVAPKKRRASNGKQKAPPKKKVKAESDASEDETPAPKSKAKKRATKVKNESDDEDSKPLKKTFAKRAPRKAKQEDGSATETPQPKKRNAKPKEEADAKGKAKKGKKKDEEDEEDVFRWWEVQDAQGDGSQRWQTLEHSGVLFPPAYEPLPRNVKLRYNGTSLLSPHNSYPNGVLGKPVDLPPEAEEVAGFYAALIETDHAQDATFNKNFFEDFTKVLEKYPPVSGVSPATVQSCSLSDSAMALKSPNSRSAISDRCSSTSRPKRPRRRR